MEWDKFLKRYIWNDQKTPYLVAARRLTRTQADSELYVYTLFLGVLFAFVAVAAVANGLPSGRSPGVGLYAFSVVCATVLLAFHRNSLFAQYCAFAPFAALVYYAVYGMPPRLDAIDHAIIVIATLLWCAYSFRVLAIVRHYPSMPAGDDPAT